MFLPVDGPLDLALTLESGQVFRWRREGEWWSGLLGGDLVLLRPRPGGLEVESAPSPPEALAERLRSFLRLEDDLPSIYRALKGDPVLWGTVHRFRGLRLLRQDPWECLASFICSVHCTIPRIRRMVESLSFRYGQPVGCRGTVRYTFPSPESLAEAGEKGLRALGLGFRAPSLARTALLLASGKVDLEALRSLPLEEARRALLSLPGVGEKVADCVLLFALDRTEAFPVDRWVRRALAEWYGLSPRLPYRALAEWARARFGPLAGYAQVYLFHPRRAQGRPRGPGGGSSRRRSGTPSGGGPPGLPAGGRPCG